MNGYAKLRLSPREMCPDKLVRVTLTKQEMTAIRSALEEETHSTFTTELDKMRRTTWANAKYIILD